MSMSVGPSSGDEDEVMSAINTTPLVDVMLVLLIIFLITVPAIAHTVPVTLPKETDQPSQTKPKDVIIAVDKDGNIYFNEQRVPDLNVLLTKMKEVSVRIPQPEVHIRGDMEARYKSIGEVVVACQRAGIQKVGFIVQPPPRG